MKGTVRNWFLLRFVFHAVVFALTLCFTPISTELGIPWVGYTWDNNYNWVWSQVLVAFAALLLDLVVLLRRENYAGLFWWTLIFDPLLGIGWWFPFLFDLWPGGDDGGSLSWILFLGSSCTVAVMVSAIAAWQAYRVEQIAEMTSAQPKFCRMRFGFTVGVSVSALLLLIQIGRAWYGCFF